MCKVILDVGYDQDFYILIIAFYKVGEHGTGTLSHYIILDGNTRVFTVIDISSINTLPCHMVELKEGTSFIFSLHLLFTYFILTLHYRRGSVLQY
jgi:nitrate reductase gamma subunit